MKVFATTIDYLILANHVEVANGLLYISGAGWSELARPANQPNHINNFGVGVSVCVPWNETNQPHDLSIRLENEDGTVVLANIDAQLNMGRPATLSAGSDQHAVVGIMFNAVFPSAGTYRVTAQIDKAGDIKRWDFQVRDMNTPS